MSETTSKTVEKIDYHLFISVTLARRTPNGFATNQAYLSTTVTLPADIRPRRSQMVSFALDELFKANEGLVFLGWETGHATIVGFSFERDQL